MEFWRDKIGGNVERDQKNQAALKAAGWRVGNVWECALKGKRRLQPAYVLDRLSEWLEGNAVDCSIEGQG